MPQAPLPPHFIGIVRDALEAIQDEITGQIVNTAQAVADIWEMDCEGDWVLYVKTAIVASGAALWLLLTPSLEEILESYLQPKPGRRHGRRGQRNDRNRRPTPGAITRVGFRQGIPDIDNAIADAIPGRDLLAGRKVAPGEYIFWSAIDVADRFLWYWLLIEATETFFTTWQSELMESGKCKAPNDAYCQLVTAKQTPFFNNNLWFAKSSLVSLIEHNIAVKNNGEVDQIKTSEQGSALVVVQGFFEVESNDPNNTGVWDLGVKVRVLDKNLAVVAEKEAWTTLSAPPDQTVSGQVDIGFVVEDARLFDFVFDFEQQHPASFFRFDASAQVSIAMRGLTSV